MCVSRCRIVMPLHDAGVASRYLPIGSSSADPAVLNQQHDAGRDELFAGRGDLVNGCRRGRSLELDIREAVTLGLHDLTVLDDGERQARDVLPLHLRPDAVVRAIRLRDDGGSEQQYKRAKRERVGAACDSPAPATGRNQQADACQRQQAAVNGPLRLAGHEAAWKNVDALEKPDASHQQEQDAKDVQCDSHQWQIVSPGPCHTIP